MHRGIFLIICFISGIIISCPARISAQTSEIPFSTNVSIRLGRSVPIGNFASMSGENSGYGKVGLCADISSETRLYPRLSWMNSINVSTNPFNQVAYSDDDPYVTIHTGRHFTGWILSGLAFDIYASDKFTTYVSGQIGLLIGRFPDISMRRYEETSNLIINYSFEQTTKYASTIAYGLSAGLKVKRMHISIRYNYAVPRYQVTTKSGWGLFYPETTRSSKEISTGMLQFLVGLNF